MPRTTPPELKKYMDKKLIVNLQGNRKVSGTLRGYDIFLNLTIEDAVDETKPADKKQIGLMVVRGNSVLSIETIGFTR